MAITGSIGRGGAGKSLRTIRALRALWRAGRPIISNTPLVDLRYRQDWDGTLSYVDRDSFGMSWASDYVRTFEDVYNVNNAEIFLDEIGAWCPSDKWRTMPDEFRRFLAQDRREGVNIHWTHRTSRIYYEVLDNTKTIYRCERWFGGMIRVLSYDPQNPAEKPRTSQLFNANPSDWNLYQTFVAIGSAKGVGYAIGAAAEKLQVYCPPYHPEQVCAINASQASLLIRKFGTTVLYPPSIDGFRLKVGQSSLATIPTSPGLVPVA